MTAIIIIVLLFMALFVGAWVCVEIGRREDLKCDLIYLEFVIRNSTTDHVSEKNIRSLIVDCRDKGCDAIKLKELDTMFREKFDKN